MLATEKSLPMLANACNCLLMRKSAKHNACKCLQMLFDSACRSNRPVPRVSFLAVRKDIQKRYSEDEEKRRKEMKMKR